MTVFYILHSALEHLCCFHNIIQNILLLNCFVAKAGKIVYMLYQLKKSVRIDTQPTNTVGTVSLAVIYVKTTLYIYIYICKNVITNDRYNYTICMYHVAYRVASHCIALYFIYLYVL